MSVKTTRIAALVATMAAVGLMSIVASASAAVTPITHENCPGFILGPLNLQKPVNGSLTVKKLNQTVPLKNGVFGGVIGLCLENEAKLTGSITEGTIVIPAFTAPIKILWLPSEVGMEIKQSGPGEGTITKPAGEECPSSYCNANEEFDNITLNVQAHANITFTTIKIFGLTVPTKCTTVKPVSLPFVKEMTLFELLEETTITGSTTMPPVRCEGPLGLLEGATLTALFSGPNNPYSLTFGETTILEA
jgi:hypothetical protein